MKPLFLSMSAFGPYKDTETVDFTRIGDSLYRITGETGAGKTTIFDAICFALFEESSNKQKGTDTENGSTRDKTMLHSTLAPMNRDTVVELRFSEDGKEYLVRRSIHFTKKRDGTGYGDASFSAELSGNGLAVSQSKKVNEEIRRIIGMDSTQFRQIVMLAQGEFKAFMESKDNARKAILSRLFGGESYARLMKLLSDSLKQIGEQLKEEKQIIGMHLQKGVFPLPDAMDEAERACFSPDHPLLLENIRALVEKENEQLKELRTEIDRADGQLRQQQEKLAQARSDNEKLLRLSKLQEEREALEKSREKMNLRRARLERSILAFRGVRPVEAEAENRLEEKALALAERERAQVEQNSSEERLNKALTAQIALEPKKAELEELRLQRRSLEASLESYERLDQAQKTLRESKEKLHSLTLERESAEKSRGEAQNILASVTAELETLSNIQTELAEAKAETERLKEKMQRLGGLQEKIDSLRAMQQEQGERSKELLRLEALRLKAQNQYEELHRSFLAHQLAAISENLRTAIEQNGEAKCPVCGTLHSRDKLASLPRVEDQPVSEQEVNKAQKRADEAREKAHRAGLDLENVNSRLKQVLTESLKLAEELLPLSEGWDEERLLDGSSFRRLYESNEKALLLSQKHQKAARKKLDRQCELTEEKSSLEEQLLKTKETLQRLNDAFAQENANHASYSSVYTELRNSLRFETKKQAEAEILRLRKEVDALDQRFKSADENEKAARENAAGAKSRLIERDAALNRSEEALRAAEAAFNAALKSNDFDAESYRQALPPVSDGEKWLSDEDSVITAYRNEVTVNGKQLEDQRRLCEGLEMTDLGAMEAELEESKAALRQLKDADAKQQQNYQAHSRTLTAVEEALGRRRKLNAAYDKLSSLSLVANGSNSSGGKHAFDGYVLSRTFREVLDCASTHLSTMTDGRYSLRHESSGRRTNSAADFRILVLDRADGSEREVGSISGGESFQASMALALGLSDVAQHHATGGKRIDAMFVDEGFGSLDELSLNNMLTALRNISNNSRSVGLISHVNELQNYMRDEIAVVRAADGLGSHIIQR